MDPREWLFDKRVIRRNLERGVLTWKSYKEYMKSTPNLVDEYEVIDLEAAEEEEAGEAEAAEATEEIAEE